MFSINFIIICCSTLFVISLAAILMFSIRVNTGSTLLWLFILILMHHFLLQSVDAADSFSWQGSYWVVYRCLPSSSCGRNLEFGHDASYCRQTGHQYNIHLRDGTHTDESPCLSPTDLPSGRALIYIWQEL